MSEDKINQVKKNLDEKFNRLVKEIDDIKDAISCTEKKVKDSHDLPSKFESRLSQCESNSNAIPNIDMMVRELSKKVDVINFDSSELNALNIVMHRAHSDIEKYKEMHIALESNLESFKGKFLDEIKSVRAGMREDLKLLDEKIKCCSVLLNSKEKSIISFVEQKFKSIPTLESKLNDLNRKLDQTILNVNSTLEAQVKEMKSQNDKYRADMREEFDKFVKVVEDNIKEIKESIFEEED